MTVAQPIDHTNDRGPGSNAHRAWHRLVQHGKRWGIAYVTLGLAAWAFQAHFTLAVNISPSLPHQLFLIQKGTRPERGDLVAFRASTPVKTGTVTMIKILVGVPEDRVTRVGREVFVNEAPAGLAKTHSLNGTPLALGPTGVIPPGHVHVAAPHPDSLDSRYALLGWITQHQIIGKAYALY